MSILAPSTLRAYLFADSVLLYISLLFLLVFQPPEMHLGSPIQYYELYHNIQRGVVPHENPSSDAPKF